MVDVRQEPSFTGAMGIRARKSVRQLVVLLALAVTALSLPAAAHAWQVSAIDCGGSRGSGQTDTGGNLYLPCAYQAGAYRPTIQVFDANGGRRQTIALGEYATDVAPSPDGSAIYVVSGHAKVARRYLRQATGAYALDAGWRLDDYLQWGTPYRPLGEFLSTDGQGFIYFSSGTWTNSPSSVVKYTPEGRFVTQFGAWENSWNTGIFYWMNAGVASSPDGSSVYVAEVGNNRVQRFDRRGDGSYGFGAKVGNDPAIDNDPRTGWCGEDVRGGRLSAPYDVGVDAGGRLYVLNTSCVQLKRFAPDGSHIDTLQLRNNAGGYVHGLAVDARGRAWLAEIGAVATPTGVAAPTLANVGGGGADAQPQYEWINDGFSGWAYATARAPATRVDAWLWTQQGWVYRTWPTRSQAWVQPFAAGWMWAWRDNAWHAVRTRDVAR